ncbi:hypothetical protein WBG78_18195 [Chryseolinea sp. T2]|uniref:hypothetical protein n=1 Tax=Chryseolinea sp. T2 TaxID=3129255 RepID=UPI0030769CD0
MKISDITTAALCASLLLAEAALAQSTTYPSKEAQIKAAVLAAPEAKRSEAKVYGYSDKGEFVVLRTGTNDMVCLADDPAQAGLNVSCYHKDLEPFMQRGRDLKKAGKSFQEIFDAREAEVKSGKLLMPKQPSTLFVFSAPAEDFNAATGDVKGGNLRYVIYIPYATAESTGLPLKPEAPGMPWIMDPGTHRAHIMITPPAKN